MSNYYGDYNQGSRGGGRDGPRGACFSCGEPGHISRNCPKGGNSNGGGYGQYSRGGGGNRYSDRGGYGGGGGGGGGGYRNNYGAGAEPDMTFEVNCDQVGRIIGKGGCKVRELQDETGARIKITRDEQPPRVLLYGSDDQCRCARDLIKELMVDRRSGYQPSRDY